MLTVMTTGQATASVDTIAINLTLKNLKPNYETAVRLAAADLKKLQKSIMAIGFKKEDLKTINFTVDTKYERIKIKQDSTETKQKLIGYEVIHQMKIQFPYDMTRLSEVIYVIVGSGVPVEFDIRFEVSNREAYVNAALSNACLKAETQAKTLADALHVTLKGIAEISTQEHYPVYDARQYEVNYSMVAEQVIDIQPDDVVIEATVTIKYHI